MRPGYHVFHDIPSGNKTPGSTPEPSDSSVGIGKQQGFTLVEILIALFLFSIGALAIMTMSMTSIKGNAASHHSTEATLLAQDKLEEIKNTADITLLANGNEVGLQTTGSNYRYNRRWDVSNGPTAGSRQVVVTVSWQAGQDNKQVVLQTITRGNGT